MSRSVVRGSSTVPRPPVFNTRNVLTHGPLPCTPLTVCPSVLPATSVGRPFSLSSGTPPSRTPGGRSVGLGVVGRPSVVHGVTTSLTVLVVDGRSRLPRRLLLVVAERRTTRCTVPAPLQD